jgi:hypothetical protein
MLAVLVGLSVHTLTVAEETTGLVPRSPAVLQLLEEKLPTNSWDREKLQAQLDGYLLTDGITFNLKELPKNLQRVGQRALKVWIDALGDSPVVSEPGPKVGKIEIVFGSSPEMGKGHQAELQSTRTFRWGSGPSYTYKGTLMIRPVIGGRKLTEDELVQVLAHEMGHALGLDDRDSGLMGPLREGQPVCKPDAAEIKTLLSLRAALRERRRLISSSLRVR